jgi:putative transposase
MDASLMARLKELEAENRQLKKMYAEERLKAEIVKEALEKKVVKPSRRKEMAKRAVAMHKVSIRLTHNWKDWGFGLCFAYLRNVKDFQWNHKRVYRIYRELELNLRIKPKRRICREKLIPLAVPDRLNHTWSMDFHPNKWQQ